MVALVATSLGLLVSLGLEWGMIVGAVPSAASLEAFWIVIVIEAAAVVLAVALLARTMRSHTD